MRIAIDCRHTQIYQEGITRTTLLLLDLLKKDVEFHAIFYKNARRIKEIDDQPSIKKHYLSPTSSKLDWVWENYSLPALLKRIKPNIYHAPCNAGLPFFKLDGIKYCVTVHDLLIKHFPAAYKTLGRLKWYIGMQNNIKNADCIICDSDFTENEIKRTFPNKRVITKRVHLALDNSFISYQPNLNNINTSKAKFKLDSPYIVYHGGFRKYKDVSRIVNIFNSIKERYNQPLKLCLIGKTNKEFKSNVLPAINTSRFITDINFTDYINDVDMRTIITGGLIHLYLSKMEGFGFAPLEAMACGTPSVSLRNSSLIETLDNACYWIQPEESNEIIAQKIISLISDPDKLKTLSSL
ncbi:MAG: glycosyltransferase, partial [Fibrobacteres bacterium]|nr:glycosyltransferase [Fibrobacterota bacterium]